MKKETKTIIINHPDLGKLEKSVTFTYDETKYKSLDECIADHEKCDQEKNAECDLINSRNKAKRESIEVEDEKIWNDAEDKFKISFSNWEKEKESIQLEYEEKIKSLQKEFKKKYEEKNLQKPIKVNPELNLKKFVPEVLDNSKYEGRGYLSKEMAAKEAPIDLINILASATPEQIEILKAVLK